MARAQLRQCDILANGAVQAELDAARLELRVAAQHHVLLQLEGGYAVDHQPADAVVAVIDRHLVALQAQALGRGEARGTRTDDAHGLGALAQGRGRLHPAHLPGGVGDVFLHGADGDALEPLLDDAVALTQAVLRADAAADLGEGIGGRGDLVRFLQPAFGGELQPVGNVVLQWAMDRAEGHATLAAPARLVGGFGRLELVVDLIPVGGAGARVALFRLALLQPHELEHALGHDRDPLVAIPGAGFLRFRIGPGRWHARSLPL